MRKGAANDNRRIRLLGRLRPSHHRREVDELAVIFGLVLGPDLLHRLDPLAHQLEAGFEDRAMVLDFLGIPAATNAEEKAPARDLIYRGNELCRLDGVTLHD